MAKVALIVASHGLFAQEAIKSAEMIIGHTQENIGVVSVTEGKAFETCLSELQTLYQTLDTTEGCLIFTDIYGGTPANIATYLAIEHMESVQVFSGLNLPVLLEILLDQTSSLEELTEKIEQIHGESLANISEKLKGTVNEDVNQVDSY